MKRIIAGLLLMAGPALADGLGIVYAPNRMTGCSVYERAAVRDLYSILGWTKPKRAFRKAHAYFCVVVQMPERHDYIIGQILSPKGVVLCDLMGQYHEDGCFTLSACGTPPQRIC